MVSVNGNLVSWPVDCDRDLAPKCDVDGVTRKAVVNSLTSAFLTYANKSKMAYCNCGLSVIVFDIRDASLKLGKDLEASS